MTIAIFALKLLNSYIAIADHNKVLKKDYIFTLSENCNSYKFA